MQIASSANNPASELSQAGHARARLTQFGHIVQNERTIKKEGTVPRSTRLNVPVRAGTFHEAAGQADREHKFARGDAL